MNWGLVRVQIKANARKNLSGNWIKGMLLCVVPVLLTMFCAYFFPLSAPDASKLPTNPAALTPEQLAAIFRDMLIPDVITRRYLALIFICMALFLLLIPPFQLGLKEFFQCVYRGEKPKMRTVFYWYMSFDKIFAAIGLYLYRAFLSLFWGILILALPLIIIAAGANYNLPALHTLGNLLYIIALFLLVIKLMAYVPADFLYVGKPEIGIRNAVRNSVFIMRGHKRECLVFQLSFMLWNMIALINTIARAFVDTYYFTSLAGFVDYLVAVKLAQTRPKEEPVQTEDETAAE